MQNTKSVFLCHPAVLNYSYAYDKGGNITKKTIYPYTAGSLNGVAPTQTIVYNYGNSSWTDLLTSYNGQNIAYDAIGNPTSYLGYTLKWNGRQLSSLSGNGTTASYKYDADGLRSYKKVNGVETTYQYVGDKLMYEKRGTTEFYYYYNSFGNLAGIKYVQNGTEYMVYAVCNMRGDVEDLYWGSGNLACHYTYDTWGNVISVTDINGKEITNANHIGLMNPIRYRGYYYDSEIGMYYLQSRYYNPQVGRFINADGYVKTPTDSLFSTNMFAFCENNPVNKSDLTGDFAVPAAVLGGIALWKIGVAVATAAAVLVATYVVADTLAKNPPTFPSISVPKIKVRPKAEIKDKTKDIAPSRPRRDPVHHIVAKADPRAAESRKILRDVGIEPVTDLRNLVILPQSYHASLHTTAYHNYITERLQAVEGDKAGVEDTLASLKEEILARSAAGIRWE